MALSRSLPLEQSDPGSLPSSFCSATEHPPRTGPFRTGSLLRSATLTALLVFSFFIVSPVASVSDPFTVPHTAHSLLYERDLDLSEYGYKYSDDYALIEFRGDTISFFPWMTAALTVPIIAAQDALSTVGVVRSSAEMIDTGESFGLQRFGGAIFATTAVLILALVTRSLVRSTGDPSTVTERWWFLPVCGSVLALGTSMWSTASRGLWQHAPGMIFVGLAWLAVLQIGTGQGTDRPDRSSGRFDMALAAAAGFCCGIAFWIRPVDAAFGIGIAGFIVLHKRHVATRFGLGGVVALLMVGLANIALLGAFLPPYFSAGRGSLHGEFGEAIAANLISPSRGLLVFSPFLMLALLAFLPSRRPMLGSDVGGFATFGVASVVLSLVIVSSYGTNWWAGHSYGPRFMSESVAVLGPLTLAVLFGPRPKWRSSRVVSTVLAPVLIVVSIAMHAPGALTHATDCWNRFPDNVDDNPARLWSVSDAVFLYPFTDDQGGRASCRGSSRFE